MFMSSKFINGININLSIIIPFYNNVTNIGKSIEGAISQLGYGDEIICIDDGSTDGSLDIVKNFANKDNRIKFFIQQNLGPGVARNVGIKAARGEYIAFLDADDYYPSKNILSRLYAVAKENNALICGGSFMTDNNGRIEEKFDGNMTGDTFNEDGWINFYDYQFDYAFYRFIYNRQFLIENNLFFPNYRRYQDPPFMLQAFAKAGKFYAIRDITYCYTFVRGAVQWSVDKILDLLAGIEDNLIFSAEKGYRKIYRLNYHRLCQDFCNAIVETALNLDFEGNIVKKLLKIQIKIDRKILLDDTRFNDEEIEIITPLKIIVDKMCTQRALLRKEGWFVKNKIFRFYTLPLRRLGCVLRRLKHKK